MDNNVMFEEQDVMEEAPKGKRRMVLIIVGVVVLAAVLGGAAFVGGQMLSGQKNQAQTGTGGNGLGLMIQGGPGGPGGGRQVQLDMKPAQELPQLEPDVQGIYQSRSDNTLKVGTGRVTMGIQVGQDGKPQTSASFDGPVVEVVVTGDTEIYHDVTEMPLPDADIPADDDGVMHMQQVVELADGLDDISKDAHITVWGEKSGDRVIAHVLVYRNLGE